ncbi:MAG: hypothetical protein OXF79_15370, partial [Chloroflexi bacterium]|nr:hypothetical protein [Chloroflexota bacterium]
MTRDTASRVVGLSGLCLVAVAVVVLAGCAGAGDPAAGVPVGPPGGPPVASGGVIEAAEVDGFAVGGE